MSGVLRIFDKVYQLLFAAVFLYFCFYEGPPASTWAKVNTVVQLLIFLIVACVPCWKYEKMWFVDLAWPFGLVFLGIGTLYYGDS
jgi:hypothetical protein